MSDNPTPDSSTDVTTVSRADLEAIAAGDLEPDDVLEPDGATRREWLEALGWTGIGAALAGGSAIGLTSVGGASSQGQLGSDGQPLSAAYLSELRGPIIDDVVNDESIQMLVNMRVAEEGANIDPGNDTLVIRYEE